LRDDPEEERAVKIQNFETMYIAELREARCLEELLLKAWPNMADAADDPELKDTFRAHAIETSKQLDNLQEILDRNAAPTGALKDCMTEAMIDKASEIVDTIDRGPLRDAALISIAQRIEHYQIAVYGTLATYAKMLGRHDEKRMLGAILEEERAVDGDLTEIADDLVNPHALAVRARSNGHAGTEAVAQL
jgi:ferritin-like metal-binding protein YciE